jgi:hypothetical protein
MVGAVKDRLLELQKMIVRYFRRRYVLKKRAQIKKELKMRALKRRLERQYKLDRAAGSETLAGS